MKKILIWVNTAHLSNSGGPAGYLYNIKYALPKSNDKNIFFLSDIVNNYATNSHNIATQKASHSILKKLKKYASTIYMWYIKRHKSEYTNIDFNQFDIIHFHRSIDLSQCGYLLNNYTGKIVLTSHSPQPLCDEILENTFKSKLLIEIIKPIVRRRELLTWRTANYLLFPVEEAVESYYAYDKMRKYYENNRNKFIFCPSSIAETILDRKQINIRRDLNIPSEACILCYIGRHNEIKGYDFLKMVGQYLLNTIPNLYIVVGGKEEPLKGLKHNRWIELGWIDYGPELIRQSDVFILPNKSTFFDLVALEVLREGTPLILSYTGGNKHFFPKGKSLSEGIFTYQNGDIQKIVEIIKKIKDSSPTEITYMRERNQKLFKSEFTTSKFLKLYRNLMESLS